MRVLGIDPGLTRCGIGIVSGAPGSTLSLDGVGVIMTPTEADLDHRLLSLHSEITQWVQKYSPDVIAVERVFSQEMERRTKKVEEEIKSNVRHSLGLLYGKLSKDVKPV